MFTSMLDGMERSIPHPRMPAILKPQDYDQWLDPENRDLDGLSSLAQTYPASEMAMYGVGPWVNRGLDDPRCIESADLESLF